MVSGIQSALSGLMALQKKTAATAHNTANVNTDGYKKVKVTLSEGTPVGTIEARAEKIETPGPVVQEQTAAGTEMVEKSNVDLAEEMPNLMLSRRYFQANLKVVQSEDERLGSLLNIKS
ncbi:flagellar basal body rod C-terminal domain-containing protein [Desulfurivibrio dismutans]|uniref:flagellar basal body rod C-terminal domain-containing protein n=1 Tax=Desulfurivibrio dismutans TaxID=1398908 RepID=UPI0023DA3B3C|nr:flagellar basal body rod C-terminal domain-containing protein [Desulfurivibrio alkaliphilus]MDF1615732.1 flagellar basal body rod C-terminal domain-containing protein [Desulfurivibrio alkaliphilus]